MAEEHAFRGGPLLRTDGANVEFCDSRQVAYDELSPQFFLHSLFDTDKTRMTLKGTKRQHSSQMSQKIQNCKNNRNTTGQANWGMW